MKARYILTRRTGADGQLEAKSRLVLWGFRDPDVLAGRQETNSSPASRLARLALLTIAAGTGNELFRYPQTPQQCWAPRTCGA